MYDLQCEYVGNESLMEYCMYVAAILLLEETDDPSRLRHGESSLAGKSDDSFLTREHIAWHAWQGDSRQRRVVVTNLENEENMDDWWTTNRAHIENSGIIPVTHVCITTIKGYQNAYAARYSESREKVHNMLKELGSSGACSVDVSSWFARMCKKLREFLVPAKGLGRSRQKMLQMLTKRCKLRKEDAVKLLQRIDADVEN
ncbi:hypothetical protein DEU56DRAFT_761460 [Suillus clintonianus]|uniref:uncharacterized protein n=1 Tax=Suillus clintonianus TaxID=1904413 RepID=UPI001B85F25D|nr:uncharacterized protein DEU56DRAFT_761460 [Suillus clintonianus]KAG2116830.1 hypothetical protein DEU56DRAFT_761460 [Suillus clintonianus]